MPLAADRPANEPEERAPSMRELLASCAAADAVSTPPREPHPCEAEGDGEQGEHGGEGRERDAA
ncbi:hypothetical protein AB0K09_06550 [Streptomyces sp. NPDC049577]|uniref:hypothetical protein n=1 Tax=Streptomyces sp. NPDC049577 TaxID=3155153 RepID=UPI003427ECEF